MTRMVESFVAGRWFGADDDGTIVRDAITGKEVARVSSRGVDVNALVAHGREQGGPALRALTFHERASILKTLAQTLNEHKEELYSLSAHTGATLADSQIDIDGGIGTLFSYASKGKRELPNERFVVDGGVESLGKRGTFVGQHLYVSRAGVAVQINAFNFPVWGMLEKFAPAFLAGVPSIVKPATPTAYLTEAAVRPMVGVLPEGSLQLMCGRPAGLLDALDGQDYVAFTGSASTAQRLRSLPAVINRAVRFNAEADSLNCSILGPDGTRDTPEFELFVDQLVREMTVKAGQKCTAIRRALVPRALVDDVVAATVERLAKVVVGNPAESEVTMGALVSLEQREEVRRALKALTASATVAFGDSDRVEPVGANAETGAFMSPILLRADDPNAAEVHQVEAFGPVSTVLGYDDVDHAVALAARGEGSLVGSIVSHDPEVVRSLVLGAAVWHGRLLVLDRDDARESTGHGSPLPMLVHGGPGRAGGGEELGGLRGVFHHMQRTAVQASPAMLTAITGVWTAGAPAAATAEHPFRKHLEDLRVGDQIVGGPRTVTLDDIEHFAEFTGDTFYAHMDEEAAAANPFFGRRVAHGYLVLAFAAGLFVDPAPGPVLANYGLEHLRFLTPTYPGDEITVTLTAKDISPRSGAPYGEVRWDAVVTNQEDKPVATYDVLTLVAKRDG